MPENNSSNDSNTVYIGKKSIMSYVLAVVAQFNQGARKVSVKARGKTISRAVDVAEIVRNKFISDARPEKISIKTEELSNPDGTTSKVSAIEILLSK